METNDNPIGSRGFQGKIYSHPSPFEANTSVIKIQDNGWRCLLAKIYQNINGPTLKKKISSKVLNDQEISLSSDSTNFRCNCKKTKCLKLYCQCFSRGQYCNDCHCDGCNNTSQYDIVRSSIIDEIIQKNPNVFDAFERTRSIICICRKTGCLKKYCQCFNIGKKCGSQCKCANCLNTA